VRSGFKAAYLFASTVADNALSFNCHNLAPRTPPLGAAHTPDPDALAAEFISRGLELHEPLSDIEDRLRGFEVKDLDGYVLFFGRPG